MYHHALLTTDGSQVARAAFRHVRQVVDPAGAVTIVQVIDDPVRLLARTTPAGFEFSGTGGVRMEFIDEVIDAQRAAAEVHLAEVRALVEADGIANVETVVLTGLPGEAIVGLARERSCDVVIMATHGRSGLRRTVLGSVADHVLRHLDDIPVLLVHPSEDAR